MLALFLFWATPEPAHAVRFGLGVASDLTPLVIDASRAEGSRLGVLFGFRPVLDVELARTFSVGAYAPFTIYRSFESNAASSGAESIFGLSASARYPILREVAPEEILAYVSARGGFGTSDGRAGPFFGGALGASFTWLATGRGLFAEVQVSRLDIEGIEVARDVARTWVGLSLGLVFRLGGEDWKIRPPRSLAAPAP